MIKISAPGKAILFGEHAVVYDKLGVACTIDRRCQVKMKPSRERRVIISSGNLQSVKFLKERELLQFLKKVNSLVLKKEFKQIQKLTEREKLAPAFFVLANIFDNYGFNPLEIEIDSNIPKNLGSSAALFSALSFGTLKILGKEPQKKEVSNFSFLGDILAHGGTPSGIDNTVVTYGGYIAFKKSKLPEPLKIDFKIPLLIVDSGQESKTADTVSYIRKTREKKAKFVNSVINSLDGISKKSLFALKSGDLKLLGSLMTRYYRQLKKLGVSTRGLDQIMALALENKALGAKPTGGWGGGCCLVLTEGGEKELILKKLFEREGFKSFSCKTGVKGVGSV